LKIVCISLFSSFFPKLFFVRLDKILAGKKEKFFCPQRCAADKILAGKNSFNRKYFFKFLFGNQNHKKMQSFEKKNTMQASNSTKPFLKKNFLKGYSKIH
jgi:hypothetical protein